MRKMVTIPSDQSWYDGKMGVSIEPEYVLRILPTENLNEKSDKIKGKSSGDED